MGVFIRVATNENLRDGLQEEQEKLQNLTPAFEEIGIYAAGVMRRRMYDNEVKPESNRARRDGGATLVDTGRLANSITHRAAADHVLVGTNVAYAEKHQNGLEGLPVRQFLVVTPEIEKFMQAAIENHLKGDK